MRICTSGWAQQAVIWGDATNFSIAAASVLAKVHRDRLLVELDRELPVYSLARHKGYGSPAHLSARKLLRPTPLHRKSFHPVAQALLRFPSAWQRCRRGD